MICLNDLLLQSNDLRTKIQALFYSPSYLANGLADYLDGVASIPPPSFLQRAYMGLKNDIFLSGVTAIVIPSVSISPSPNYPDSLEVLLHGDSQSTAVLWTRNITNNRRSKLTYEEFSAREGDFAGKTYTVELLLLMKGKARIPHINDVHSDPLNPNDLKRLKKEPSRHLLPGYALG